MYSLKTIRTNLAFFSTLLLIACGGGSSGGGGQEDNTNNQVQTPPPNTPPPANPPQAVTYNGTANYSLTAPGFPAINDTAAIQVVVQGNNVTLTVDGVSVNATLNNGAFTVTVPISETDDGITCNGSATVNGTVSGNTVNGTIAGNGNCTGNGLNVPVTLTGSFNAQASGP